ncbi:kinase-like domain-containing protein [Mycena filopes]|nr:kinase-like domain-containing protein [Mycena filopes]
MGVHHTSLSLDASLSLVASLWPDAPFGAWPKDLHWESVAPPPGTMPLSISASGRVDRFPQHGVVTRRFNDPDESERVCGMMDLAGDSAVSRIGRLFECGGAIIIGFCMPIETPVDPANIGTKEERVRIIYQLRDLVAELHKKNIIHGDVKPHNLLMCSDNRLRFCDFENASIEGDGFATTDLTTPYCSPYRARNDEEPMTRAEDVYAMGLSMWHIYTGKVPFINVAQAELEKDVHLKGDLDDFAFTGCYPDMTLIDDPDIASLIETSLANGPSRPDVFDSGQYTYCIENQFVFGHCTAQPRHTYSRTIHSLHCDGRPCKFFCADPKVFTSDLEPLCTKCNTRVEYSGLG